MNAAPTSKVVVIGTGSIGLRHLQVLRQLPGVSAWALPIRAARAEELTQSGYPACASLEEAVRNGAERAIIATDTLRHPWDAQRALRAGLTVMVEKPLAVDASAARGIEAAARSAEREAYVGCVLRFSEALRVYRQKLALAGRLHTVRIECQSYLPDWRPGRAYRDSYSARSDEGGVLRDLIHEVDYAGWLFGWPAAVQARLRNINRLGIAAEESAEMWWETECGGLVSVQLDYLTRPPHRRMRAYGENGVLEWDAMNHSVTWSAVGEAPQTEMVPQPRDALYLAQTAAFLEAVRERVDERLAPSQDGVRALAVCDAARAASLSRREERVIYS